MKSISAAVLLAGTLITFAAAAKDPELLSLSAEHFTQSASVTEEAQSTRITTERGYIERAGILGEVWHDEFLSARIDHDSKKVSYEIDVALTYRGASRAYQTAQFRGLDKAETVPVQIVKRQAINCPTGECTYTEHMAIPIEEPLLRRIAQGYASGKPELWRFRVLANRAPQYQGALSNAEVAGLLARVDAYLQNPAVIVAPPAPPAPARLDFGISGLAVAPGTDGGAAAERAGVLVAGVTKGSIAQKAGVIVGDIVYEVDGHPIHSPADLQTVLRTVKPGSSAQVRLYRGTDAKTMEVPF